MIPLVRDVWEARRQRPSIAVDGPGLRLLEAAKAAGWTWSAPTTFTPAAAAAALDLEVAADVPLGRAEGPLVLGLVRGEEARGGTGPAPQHP